MSDYTAEYHKLLTEDSLADAKLRAERIARQLKIAISACKTAESLNSQPLFYDEDGGYVDIPMILKQILNTVEDPGPNGWVAAVT